MGSAKKKGKETMNLMELLTGTEKKKGKV